MRVHYSFIELDSKKFDKIALAILKSERVKLVPKRWAQLLARILIERAKKNQSFTNISQTPLLEKKSVIDEISNKRILS